MWFLYVQATVPEYDEKRGVSRMVYIEAESLPHADVKFESLGFDFSIDEDYDEDYTEYNHADFYRKNAYYIPEEWEGYPSESKQMKNDQYEAFVHPLDKPFYGVGKTLKVGRDGGNGYGVQVWPSAVSKVYALDENGGYSTKDLIFPAPGRISFLTGSSIVHLSDGVMCDTDKARYWLFWFKKKKQADAFRKKIKKIQDALRPDPLDFLDD